MLKLTKTENISNNNNKNIWPSLLNLAPLLTNICSRYSMKSMSCNSTYGVRYVGIDFEVDEQKPVDIHCYFFYLTIAKSK